MASHPADASELVRLAAELAAVEARLAGPLEEGALAPLLERAEVLSRSVALAPPRGLRELALKLDLLCARLRQTVDPGEPRAVLTYILAESARDDLRRLAG